MTYIAKSPFAKHIDMDRKESGIFDDSSERMQKHLRDP